MLAVITFQKELPSGVQFSKVWALHSHSVGSCLKFFLYIAFTLGWRSSGWWGGVQWPSRMCSAFLVVSEHFRANFFCSFQSKAIPVADRVHLPSWVCSVEQSRLLHQSWRIWPEAAYQSVARWHESESAKSPGYLLCELWVSFPTCSIRSLSVLNEESGECSHLI